MNKYRSVVLLISIKSFFFFLKCDELEQMTTVLIHCPASHPEERKKQKERQKKKEPTDSNECELGPQAKSKDRLSFTSSVMPSGTLVQPSQPGWYQRAS